MVVNEYALLGTVEDKPTTFTPLPARFHEMSQNPLPNTISEKRHFDAMDTLASKYESEKQSSFEDSVRRIGNIIAIDYPFPYRGAGCNTLAGQLDSMSKDNRDCKLPTFILALALSRLYPEYDIKIVIDRLSPFHPIIQLQSGEKMTYGEYLTVAKKGVTVFHLSMDAKEMSMPETSRMVFITPDLEGMQTIDEAFINDSMISH